MRKSLAIIIALWVSSMTLLAERVSRDDAALVANHFMNVASSNTNVRMAAPAKKMVHKAMTEENLFYLYENEDGEGWVIIAADDAVTPILAYSETGHFCTDNMPNNIRKWLGNYNDFIRRVEADSVEASEEAAAQWNELRENVRKASDEDGNIVIGPLVKTKWDQGSPYWNKCPGSGSNRAYTGCVATAMAQVMKYWEWPKQGKGSLTYQPLDPNSQYYVASSYPEQSADFGATIYDWDNMLKSYKGTATSAQKTAVAILMYHCGVATQMMYGSKADGGSGTMTVNFGDWSWGLSDNTDGGCAQNALYSFFRYQKPIGYMRDGYTQYGKRYYNAWTDDDWTAMIKEELDKKHPIMYGGEGSGGGHSFICDGYTDQNYFHFNWGWSGENDGYYKLDNLVPGSGGAGGGSYSFSQNQDVLINIVPDYSQGIENVEDGENAAQKLLIDGHVIVVRGQNIYTIFGQKIQ